MASFQVTELMVSLAECSGENTSFCDGDSKCPGGTHPCNEGTQCPRHTDCPGENTSYCDGDSKCPGGTHPCNEGTKLPNQASASSDGAFGPLRTEPLELSELRMLLADTLAGTSA